MCCATKPATEVDLCSGVTMIAGEADQIIVWAARGGSGFSIALTGCIAIWRSEIVSRDGRRAILQQAARAMDTGTIT
jgi:hypothetical protein